VPPKHRPKKKEDHLNFTTDVTDHVFSNRREGSRIGGARGWLRVTEHAVPAEHKEWKIGKRKREPEKELPNVEKLQAKMVAQLSAGELPRACTRRATMAERVRTQCANLKRKRAKQLRVGRSIQSFHAAG